MTVVCVEQKMGENVQNCLGFYKAVNGQIHHITNSNNGGHSTKRTASSSST